MGIWQSVLDAVYPPGCALCDAEVVTAGGLCGACWRATPFARGCVCDLCGTPLQGDSEEIEHCDDCLGQGRPWSRGRAALVYRDAARGAVLKLKHGDRLDLAMPAARWMAASAGSLWPEAPLLVPVPLGWRRLVTRRYNQAALLARALGRTTGHPVAARALLRSGAPVPRDRDDREARFAMLEGAIRPHPRYGSVLAGRNVVLVDDVMTTGATFAAAAEAVKQAGAADIRVLALARATRDA